MFDIWVCQACLLAREHGEPDPGRQPDDAPPWALLKNEQGDMSYGLPRELHEERGCPGDGDRNCDCGTDAFSTRPCDGCGSRLYGPRYAYTMWAQTHVEGR
ncbi:hypothetical protein Kisp01_70350 [Kineosporia sp. NBRC 101677]|nr:hypothetical protein Kisp01_70350 [Kineosporia sp. NBRC 101677]